jgi:hypothetical protein
MISQELFAITQSAFLCPSGCFTRGFTQARFRKRATIQKTAKLIY